MGEVFGGEFATCAGDAGREGLQGGVGLEGNANAGENAEAVEEVGIEREAQVGEGMELVRVMGIGGGEHSGSGDGGFGERRGLVQHGNSHAPVMEFEGEREAHDAGTGDADVMIRKDRVVHGISLVRLRRGYSLGVPVCRLAVGDREHRGSEGLRCKPRSGR